MAKRQTKYPPHHRTKLVCNKSSRHGAKICAIAVHSTESADIPKSWNDLNSITNWFDNPKSNSSSHIGIDGDGHSIRWVKDSDKAWTILVLNGVTLNIEFIGRAAQSGSQWEDAQIREGARWAAYWCIKYGIPAQRGNVRSKNGQAYVSKRGIIRHSDLTAAGVGSHKDPGKGFPMSDFIKKTQWYRKNGWTR